MADPYVLAVQEWLNATYGSVSGFIAVPETGNTGWSTMYGLTMGLQHELGIAALSTAFGPTTLARLAARSDIGPGEANTNIVRIVQGGLYCQGYNPNGFDGSYGPGCAGAVASIQSSMGFTPAGTTVTPKVFKGLLTMNAYTLLSGGVDSVRTVQQWLNRQYISRTNFFIAPCDGLYSRNVQQNLVYALQFEIGMDDATANGNFGSGTKAGLQAQGLFSVGAADTTKNFVRLFHAGLIFNGVQVTFDGSFTQGDSTLVETFQEFCALSPSGDADYQTWCSLLVSSGDPDRATTAIDTATPLTAAKASTVALAGYTTVGRYLTNASSTSLNKKIQPGELDIIFNAGLSVFPIYQTSGNYAAYFTYAQGQQDGANAHVAAIGYGFRDGTTIYFGVDFDATDSEIGTGLLAYFRGVFDTFWALGMAYKIGVYGTRNICQRISAAGYAHLSFVAGMSTGYSGNLGYTLPSNWAFDQIKEYTIGSGAGAIGIDKNVQSSRDLGASDAIPRTDTGINGAFYDSLQIVIDMAETWVAEHETSQSVAGLVCQWYRRNGYDKPEWDLLSGPVDDDFIATVQARFDILRLGDGSRLFATDCPSGDYGITGINDRKIDSAHMFATMSAYINRGIPLLSSEPEVADIGGYAGDLMSALITLHNRRQGGNAYTVQQWIDDYLFKDLPNSRFSWVDFIQDCEGFLIAKAILENPSAGIEVAVRGRLDESPSRLSSPLAMWAQRFGGSEPDLYANSRLVFGKEPDSVQNILFISARAGLIIPATMGEFTTAELHKLADGYTEAFIQATSS